MRAIAVDEYGEMPMLMQLPDPRLEAGQLLIKVEAAGMNPMDRFIAGGGFQAIGPAQFPLILGSDVAGVVEAVGEGTSKILTGRRGLRAIADHPVWIYRNIRGTCRRE
jgi:NADPH2:quinone reductase